MRRRGRAAVLLAAGCWAGGLGMARAAGEAAPATCTLVFGQGRDAGAAPPSAWDAVNQRFNAAVAAELAASGRRVHASVAPAHAIDPHATAQALLRQASERGCETIVDTTVFADPEARVLVVRLRAYPVLPQVDAGVGIVGLRIGPQVYVSQRDFELTQGQLDRIRPGALAAEMAGEYRAHVNR